MHPIPHVLETVILHSSMIVATVTPLLLQSVAPTSQAAEMYLLLLPLLGAVFLSGGMIMMNPKPETRRLTIGRSMFSLFFGAFLPSIVGMWHPFLESLMVKPAVLVVTGGCIAALVYVLSYPFTRKMYERAEGTAEALVQEGQRRLVAQVAAQMPAPAAPAAAPQYPES